MRGLVVISLVLWGCSEDATPGESTGGVADTTSEAATDLPSGSSSSSSASLSTSGPHTSDADEDDSAADSSPPADVPPYVAYSEVQSIFNASCVAGCHEEFGAYPSLDLSGYARNELILVASSGSPLFYVVSGDHDSSYLWHKLNGSQGSVGGMGSTMPRDDVRLSDEAIALVAAWIDNGAPP